MRKTYHPVSMAIHWLIVVLLLISIPMGKIMTEREFDSLNNVLYTLHWSIGLTVLALMVVRLGFRLVVPAPKPAASLEPWQRFLSHWTHIAIYVMLIVTPILGWLGKSAFGASAQGINVFYLFYVPTLVPRNKEMAEFYFELHEISSFILIGLIVLHVAGALYHAVVQKDGVVGRMGLGKKIAEPEA